MKNNTKIRLHLSKKLFETLTKQVLAESKANDGYTEAVKQPKGMKEVNAVEDTDKMRKMNEKMSSKEKMAKGLYKETDKMKKMEEMSSKKTGMQEKSAASGGISTSSLGADMISKGQAVKNTTGLSSQELTSIKGILDLIINKAPNGETGVALQKALTFLTQSTKDVEGDTGMKAKPAMSGMKEMSSKEKMKKGLYKEDAGKLQPGENVSWKDGSQREYKGVVQTQEEGDYYQIKVTAAPAGGHKVGAMLTKQAGDLKKDMAEGDLNEISAEMDLLQQAAPILGTILGVGGTFIASYVKALKSAKTPKEKEELNKALRNQINKSKGF